MDAHQFKLFREQCQVKKIQKNVANILKLEERTLKTQAAQKELHSCDQWTKEGPKEGLKDNPPRGKAGKS